ncbi:nucleoporin NUP188 homolog [Trichonephila clavata]|uniref:Nucleoporin NUP188 homolog n=1 Tax=Trichonephila clavata TaxID=2740835 RepID=A0A8X6L1E7_TRICU|nr:nucleoporin NUP188 homolog [Trichonephila clavata]
MARITRSAKDLWSLVCGSSVLNCKELVEYELGENSDRIINGVLFFKKSSSQSLDSLKKSVEETQYEFICKLSKLIDVDAILCHELFVSFTTYEFKGTQKTLEAQLINERHVQSLLLEVWHYYFGERLYYLLILKHILGHWQDETDQYKDIYEQFLEKYNKDNAVVNKIINQMETSINTELPTKDTHGVYMTDLLTYHWVTFILKEQAELLQLMLLYYKVIEPTIDDVQRMFSLFQSHGFGMRQSFRIMLSDDTQNLVNFIGYLESFVVVQCFELDWLFKCKESGMIGEHYLLKHEKALRKLNDSILSLGSHQFHSPILLAWLLVAQCSEFPDLLMSCNKLGKTALQLNVFDHLVSALTSSVFCGTGIVSDAANNVVYSLLSCVLSQFDLQHLGSLQPLFTIASTILQFSSIADDFWKKGEDAGIGDLFTYCLEMFSMEFCPLLNICSSLCLANQESCLKVTEQLKNIPTFTEFWENIDERDITATPESNVWQLVKDRPVYGDNNIIIPKGTFGVVLKQADKNGGSIIQWKVKINGWQICLREIYLRLQEMNYSTAFVSAESIQRVTTVAKLVNSMLKTDIDMRFHLSHLINVLFSILQRCINSASPSLEFVSVCINIAATLSKSELSDVWQQLAHIQLLPCMAYTPKNVSDMLSGICMNTGILGQIIASRECVSGDYSVCLAFLDLVTNVSLTVVKEDDNFLACVIYILRELFSYFHKWYYNEHQQRILIGQKCLNLLHNLFSVEKNRLETICKAQELCIFSLLHFEAGQTLLKIVCTGEEVIQQTILKQNSDLGDQIASMIRLSLSVLNRLLLLRNKTTLSPKAEVTPFEAVLFSTPGHTNQPQVVLMVAHYAFQRYNSRLAILAVQLLKRFAKEFPMSLLACFGSEAEAIRDHFLARLNSPYEDIRLKVSILEFLTVCVVQQPGLIEMFINVKRKGDIEIKEKENKSCLECVKKILNDKKNDSKNIYPSELLCASVEFIHALWVGHQALAMEALKEDSQFWNLMCSSLLSDELSHDNPGINAYIIRTLALEVFYNGKNRLKENVKSIFQQIDAKNSLLKWSKHIHCNESMDSSTDVSYHSLDSICVDSQDSFALLTAWRDFLLIVAVYEPLMLSSDIKEKILKDILKHLLKEMQENNPRSLILLSELLLMLSKHWQSELISLLNSEESYNPIFHILNEVAYNAESIHPREQLVVVSIAVFIVRLHSKTNLEIKNIKDWIVPCCQLLKKASFLIHQPLDPKNIEGVLKLPIVIVCLLNELIQEVQDWLSILKNHSVVPLLVSLLIKSLKLNAGLQLAHNIITLLLSMGSHKKAAEALCNTGFMPEVTLILSDIDMNMHISEKRKNLASQKNKLSRVDVYFTFLRFVTVLLQTLGNYFLQDCWNFIGVHQEAMHITLVELKNNFLREGIQDAILTCTFILQLSSHQHLWRLEHPRSLEMLLVDVCNCIYGTVAILCKPELLKYLVMHKKMPDSKPLKSLETESLLKRSSSEDGQIPAEVEEIQLKLFELLAVSLTILAKYCPEMYETMSGHTIDYAQWQLLLHVSFSIPSLDRDGPLCFGTILACVNMCLKLLVKNEKTPSPRKTVETSTPVSRQLLMYILEISLAILLSQSTVALTHPDLPVRDKQLVRRELAAELNSMNITMNRYLRRGPLSPAGLSIPATSPGLLTKSQPTEFPFMKLISNLVDKLFK